MNKRVVIICLSTVILLGLLLWWMDSDSKASGANATVYDDWSTEYDFRSNNPQDLGVLKSLIQTHTKDSFYIVDNFKDLKKMKGLDSSTFFFAGRHIQLEDSEFDELNKHVNKGATLFISSELMSVNIYDNFFEANGEYWDYSKSFYQWVGDTSLCFNRVYQQDTIMNNWFMFNPKSIKDSNYRAYLFAVNYPTAFYMKNGKGKIHLHANPSLFKNYQTVSTNGFVHVKQILKYIPRHRPVIIIDFAKFIIEEEKNPFTDEGDKNKEDTSYIRFIMESKYLRLAFLLSIILLLLYAVFRSKRRENVLPGIQPKRNMSIAFVETLSSIYLSKRSNIGVLQVMRKNFFMTIQRHYYVDLMRKETKEDQVKRLIERTGYSSEKVMAIINGLEPRKNDVTEAHLGSMYQKINDFYKETGILRSQKKYLVTGKTIEIHKSVLIGGLALIIAFMVLARGLQLLALGGGIGIVLSIVGAVLILLAVRIITKPVAVVDDTKLVVHGFLFGKKELLLTEHSQIVVSKGKTEFIPENGKPLSINHTLLNRRGMFALTQLVDYLKKQHPSFE